MIRKLFILGLGLSGMSLAQYLSKKKIKYCCWDDDPRVRKKAQKEKINLKEVSHENISNCDYLVLSPGINHLNKNKHLAIMLAKKFKIKVIADLELLNLLNFKNSLIGVTGTNGKSTTTSFIEKVLSHNNFLDSKSCGNIGIPFTDLRIKEDTILVVEASSFQLAKILKLKFKYAFLLNISNDHIDWHGSMKKYIESKLNIFKNQDKNCYSIVCIDDKYTKKIAVDFKKKFNSRLICISTKEQKHADIYLKFNNKKIEIINFLSNQTIVIPQGCINFTKAKHNFGNLLSAYTASYLLNQKKEKFIDSIKVLKNLDHRIEFLGNIKKVNFYNDSKSTNVNSAKTALDSFSNIFWILGGREKKGGLSGIEKNLKNVVKAYPYGESKNTIKKFLTRYLIDCKNFETLEESLTQALIDAMKTDEYSNIILSPACSSYDQFENFEFRGNQFKKLVKQKLKKNG